MKLTEQKMNFGGTQGMFSVSSKERT